MIRQGRLGNDNLVCNYFWSGRVDNIVRGGKVYLQRLGNGRRWRVLRQWCIMGCITMFALLIASVVKFFGIICSWKKKGKRDVTVKSDILWRCCIAIFQWNVAILIDELAWGIQVPEFMWYAFKSIVIQLRMRNIHKTFHVRESMAHWSFRFTLVVTLQTWLWRHTPGCDVTRIPAFIQDGGSWRTTGLSFVEINVVVLHKNRFIYLNCPMAVMCSIRKYQTKVLKKPRSDILP